MKRYRYHHDRTIRFDALCDYCYRPHTWLQHQEQLNNGHSALHARLFCEIFGLLVPSASLAGTNADAAAAWAQHVPSDEDAATILPGNCTGESSEPNAAIEAELNL